jgi:hypothetical protein
MPLIEVKDFVTTAQFQEHLCQLSAPKIIQTWAGSTPYQVFINRYKYRLIQHNIYNPLSNKSGQEAEELLHKYIYGVNNGVSNIGLYYNFRMFIEVEKSFLIEAPDSKLTSNLIILRDDYLDFLNQNSEKLRRISNLSNNIFPFSSKLSEKLATVSKASLLKMQYYDRQTMRLFRELDAISEGFEKSFRAESEEPKQLCENFPNMDWYYFKTPFQLEGYPDAIKEFIRALIAWFKEEMYDRKKRLCWQKTPNTYLLIEEFIEELKQVIEQPKPIEQLEIVELVNQNVTVENYPKFIFASQKDYNFFCLLANQATTFKQFSFLYRQMSEQEMPMMIVVKDKPFRDWFNGESFPRSLENCTETFQKSEHPDRIWAYKIAKQLFFNK